MSSNEDGRYEFSAPSNFQVPFQLNPMGWWIDTLNPEATGTQLQEGDISKATVGFCVFFFEG